MLSGELEFPHENAHVSTTFLDVYGWVLSSSIPELTIQIFVDDELLDSTKNWLPRIDIEKKFPLIPNSYESGFFKPVHIGKCSNGKHQLKVTVDDGNTSMVLKETTFFLEKDVTKPRDLVLVGKDFKNIGKKFCYEYLVNIGELKPNHRVLDIGCSIGRIALPLTKYLSKEGSYDGIDIVPDAINWCKKHISPKYNNFNFELADIFNKRYNPGGKLSSANYKLPYEDEYFDFIILLSVFTHMLPNDVQNYFSEISRILKEHSKCFVSFFLLTEESHRLINEGKSTQ